MTEPRANAKPAFEVRVLSGEEEGAFGWLALNQKQAKAASHRGSDVDLHSCSPLFRCVVPDSWADFHQVGFKGASLAGKKQLQTRLHVFAVTAILRTLE